MIGFGWRVGAVTPTCRFPLLSQMATCNPGMALPPRKALSILCQSSSKNRQSGFKLQGKIWVFHQTESTFWKLQTTHLYLSHNIRCQISRHWRNMSRTNNMQRSPLLSVFPCRNCWITNRCWVLWYCRWRRRGVNTGRNHGCGHQFYPFSPRKNLWWWKHE